MEGTGTVFLYVYQHQIVDLVKKNQSCSAHPLLDILSL